jgi:DNA-directed RNA polymerase subunit RPC12/RpoP
MSEYKYACPVCSQHIQCDSSLAGTAMKCPTCFQMIIAPQAPATPDQKLILLGKRAMAKATTTAMPRGRAMRFFRLGAVILLAVVIVAFMVILALR